MWTTFSRAPPSPPPLPHFRSIAVLGVDFMSENVRAILDEAGHRDVAVYRMSPGAIGCSLAEAAESDQYNRCVGGEASG